MELNQLQYFRHIAKRENISAAAKELCISQPSLSQTLKRLEQELGAPLFDRVGRNIRLNDAGKILLEAAGQIDMEIENARKSIAELGGKKERIVSLHMGCASTLLPGLLAYLQSCCPGLHFKINQSDLGNSENADIYISTQAKAGNYENILLLEERFVLALPKNHELAAKKEFLSADLAGQCFIALSESWSLGQTTRELLEEICPGMDIGISVDNPSIMRELLEASMGIALVPSRTWFSGTGDSLVLRELEGITGSRSIYLSASKSSRRPVIISRCIKDIQDFFKGYTQGTCNS